MRVFLVAALVVILAGCAVPQKQEDRGPYERRQEFSEEENKPYMGEGDSVVAGQVFLRTVGGDVKVGAGSAVTLAPTTKYFVDNKNAFLQGRPVSNTDQRANDLLRTTTADGEGRFKFKQIPAGRYFLMSSVYWQAPTGYRSSLERHGSRILDVVDVEEGENLSVSLTK